MFIDKFKKGNGYYDQEGCYYEDAESFIATGILGFCGCGMPDDAVEYVRKALQLIDDLTQLVYEEKLTIEQWKEREKLIFTDYGAEYFMWYFLDNKKLTEHGVSVPGWLTEKGTELLSDLIELSKLKD